jgi:beta-N-acetylhexosaminidase
MIAPERLAGSLVVGGFAGSSLPPAFARALGAGGRGGAILFRRNVGSGDPLEVAALTRAIRAASPPGEPALIAIDQEGGRVARLDAPLLRVPAMRTVASWGDPALAERIARAVARELAALGISLVLAPVLDVNTCADNPVIGDRAFGDDAATCARFGTAWIRGLQSAGVLACGKHFPGHGDTTSDSHLELPVAQQPRSRLDAVELVPFRAAAGPDANVACLMTAHVVHPAIDRDVPATLSRAVCTDLRDGIGFRGLLVSDDLEMKAIANRWTIEDASVQAVAAGCDALLVCAGEENQDRAVVALVREIERSPPFRARCEQAYQRVRAARARVTAAAADDAGVRGVVGGAESLAVAREIAQRMAR